MEALLDTNLLDALGHAAPPPALTLDRDRANPPLDPIGGHLGATRVLRFPYAQAIRRLIEKDQVAAARNLLATALQSEPSDPSLAQLQKVLAPPRVSRRPATGVPRDLEYRWLCQHAGEYRGQWVAVLGDRLIAQASHLKDLLAAVKDMAPGQAPLIYRFEDPDADA